MSTELRTRRAARHAAAAIALGALAACGGSPTDSPPVGNVPGGVTIGASTTLRFEIPPSTATTDYIFIAANANPTSDVVANVRVDYDGGDGLLAARRELSSLGVVDPGDAPLTPAEQAAGGLAVGLERRLRSFERTLLQRPGAREALRARGASLSVGAAEPKQAPTLGQVLSLRVPDIRAGNPCTSFFTIGARVMAVSTRAVIVQDTLAPSNGFSAADFSAIATEFDNLIYPTNIQYFGEPSDIDVSGRIMILYTPRVNVLTPKGSSGIVGGFFFGGDLFPTSLCAQSNDAELFYLLAPDPVGVFNNVRTTSQVRQSTRGTIAHEFQHMINQGVRTDENASPETVWLNEGLSHLAEDFVGRASRGFAQTKNLTYEDVTANTPDYAAFFFQNIAKFEFWMQRPDTTSPTSNHAATELGHRGAVQMFLRWIVDQYAGNNIPDFTKRLVKGPTVGVSNLTSKAGVPFDSLVTGWLLANYADDAGIAKLSPRYTYKSWNIRDVMSDFNNGAFPLRVDELRGDMIFDTSIRSGSGVYFRASEGPTSEPRSFRLLDPTTGAPASFTGARLVTLRAK